MYKYSTILVSTHITYILIALLMNNDYKLFELFEL